MLDAFSRLDLGRVYKKDFSDAERKELAKSGAAMSDGSYPITNAEDLKHAISLSGMGSSSSSAIKDHIKSRAKALGLESSLPDSWTKKQDTSVRKMDGFASLSRKAALPQDRNQSDPSNTDTTQQDPAVDTLSPPQPYNAGFTSRRSQMDRLKTPGAYNR